MNNIIKKKLNLNKYSFLNYLKGDFFAWINCDENYLLLTKRYPKLIDITPWRYKFLNKNRVDILEQPSTLIDGLDVEKFAKIFYKYKYSDYSIYDFSEEKYRHLSNKEKVLFTKQILSSSNNLLIFEASFSYLDFNIKTDILIKNGDKIKVLELKAVTAPLYYHALDLMFQKMIIKKNINEEIKNWSFYLLTLNVNFVNNNNYNDFKFFKNLFKEWNLYFKSKPSNLEKAINSNNYLISKIIDESEWQDYFLNFDYHLNKIKKIQENNEMPTINLEPRNFKGIDSNYEQFYLELAGSPTKNSVFDYFSDSGFNKWKKANFLIQNKTTIFNIKNFELVSNNNLKKLKEKTKELLLTNEDLNLNNSEINNDIKENAKFLKRIIQKYSLKNNSNFVNNEKLQNFLTKNFHKIIYMFDFETVSQAVPRIKGCQVFEQIPYQYSIHVILNKDDFDFKKNKNVVHLEWLVKDSKDFYDEFWSNFIKDISKYGPGTYVSYNKQFENMIIKNRLNKVINNFQEIEILEKILNSTVDLMDPFKEMWYYASDFQGSYSIKKVGPHFAPEINYNNLDPRVRKGDQSAKQCKIWLIMNNDEYNKNWQNIRNAMLKYCEYDTLLMVVLFQKLLKFI